MAVYAEERRQRSLRLDRHQRAAFLRTCIGTQDFGETLDRRRLDERSERLADTELRFNFGHHLKGEQRMSTEVEEVVADSDLPGTQHVLPDLQEPALEVAARRR